MYPCPDSKDDVLTKLLIFVAINRDLLEINTNIQCRQMTVQHIIRGENCTRY